jgi:hypothetical protein
MVGTYGMETTEKRLNHSLPVRWQSFLGTSVQAGWLQFEMYRNSSDGEGDQSAACRTEENSKFFCLFFVGVD